MKQKQPLISVVMPVYNAGSFLVDATESILNQTYKNFEFIIVDDASTDTSLKILKSYARANKKIKLLKNTTNKGVSITVKRAITQSRGSFIARMDADDIALPNRLEKQVSYLIAHKKTVAVGCQCLLIDKEGKIIGEKKFPEKFEDIYKYIYLFVPVQQPTLMIAKKRLPADFTYYADGMNTAEEVELFFKLFQYGKVENLPNYLFLYRLHDSNTSLANVKKTFVLTLTARIKALFYYNYKPRVWDIFLTILQTVLVLLLPQSIILICYKMVRKLSNYTQIALFSFRKTSIDKAISV